MDLWFGYSQENLGFNRQVNLKAALFDFFADHSKTPVSMDYISMVSNSQYYLIYQFNISMVSTPLAYSEFIYRCYFLFIFLMIFKLTII